MADNNDILNIVNRLAGATLPLEQIVGILALEIQRLEANIHEKDKTILELSRECRRYKDRDTNASFSNQRYNHDLLGNRNDDWIPYDGD